MEAEGILQILKKSGLRGAIVPYSRVEEARAEIRDLLERGMLNKEFYSENLPFCVDGKPPKSMPIPKSVLIVSTPAVQHTITFELDRREHKFAIPPTYGEGALWERKIRGILKDAQSSDSFRLIRAYPPLKLMAVKSGLAMYGRNNITYVPEFGSYQLLMGFYSDVAPVDYTWDEKKALPKCVKCRACMTACPTGAISDERFLLRAEKCIACMSERSSDHAFPSWVRPEWHDSIVGCMKCQRACPYNKDLLSRAEEGYNFSEKETRLLLNGRLSGKSASSVRTKLKKAGLDESIFPRNLEVLLKGQLFE